MQLNHVSVIPAPNFDGPTMEGQDDYNYEDYNTGDETQIGNGTEVTTSIKDEGKMLAFDIVL